MTLPSLPRDPVPADRSVSDRAPRRALVVDDDEAMRQWVARVLAGDQWLVIVAENGEVAKRLLDVPGGETLLLVTDLDMPHVNGLQLLAWREQVHPGAASILMSGALVLDRRDRPWLHEVPLLDKPFSASELLSAVQRVLPLLPVP